MRFVLRQPDLDDDESFLWVWLLWGQPVGLLKAPKRKRPAGAWLFIALFRTGVPESASDHFLLQVKAMSTDTAIQDALSSMEVMLRRLLEKQQHQEWYSAEEFAHLVGRSAFTCRQWCRLGRIYATKKGSGRGAYLGWAISHDELLRYRREGLRPAVAGSDKR